MQVICSSAALFRHRQSYGRAGLKEEGSPLVRFAEVLHEGMCSFGSVYSAGRCGEKGKFTGSSRRIADIELISDNWRGIETINKSETMNKYPSILNMWAFLFVVAIVWGCGQKENKENTVNEENEMTAEEGNARGDNALTEAEKNEGWQLLFDGKSMEHFRGFRKDKVPEGWQVEDGAITLTGKGAGDIITKEQYEDFELSIDWKISEGGNSGIFYHVSEDTKYKNTYNSGPEMQVLDDEGHPDAKKGVNGNRKAGSLYDLLPLSTPAVKPAGEWNTARLVVNDGKVEHWLNGKKVVEYELGTPEWDSMIAKSKFATMEGFGAEGKGHIALQDHGDKVWFKNIKIRPL